LIVLSLFSDNHAFVEILFCVSCVRNDWYSIWKYLAFEIRNILWICKYF